MAGAAIMRGMDDFNLGQRGRTAVTILERKRRLFKEVSEILCSQSYCSLFDSLLFFRADDKPVWGRLSPWDGVGQNEKQKHGRAKKKPVL